MQRSWHPVMALYLCALVGVALVHVSYLAFHGWGESLLPAYHQSDAYYYNAKAWYLSQFPGADSVINQVVPESLYVDALALCYRVFGSHAWVPFLLNGICFALSAGCMGHTTRLLFGSAAAYCAITLVCLCGPLVFFAGLTLKTLWALWLISAGVLCLVAYGRQQRVVLFSLGLLLIGLAAIERSNIAVVALVAVTTLYRGSAADGLLVRLGRTALVFGTPVVILMWLSGWNPGAVEQEFFAPVGLNIYVGNAPGSKGGYTSLTEIPNSLYGHRLMAVPYVEKELGRPVTRAEASWFWIEKSLDYYSDHPVEYLGLLLRKVGLLFAALTPNSPEQYRVWRWENPVLSVTLVDWSVIWALSVVGFLLSWRVMDQVLLRFFVGSAVTYALTLFLFFVFARYRFALLPLLIPFAGWGVVAIWNRLRQRQGYKVAASVVALTALGQAMMYTIPAGDAWTSDQAAYRSRELELMEQIQPRYRARHEAANGGSAASWEGLSRREAIGDHRRDALLSAERAIEMEPGNQRYYLNFMGIARKVELENPEARLELLLSRAPEPFRSSVEAARLLGYAKQTGGR